MLYVFKVDTGTTLTFDINHAIESVGELKREIRRVCNIPVEQQILLASGGKSLDSNAPVCMYSAGIDTNPIFLFNALDIEAPDPPHPSVEVDPNDIDLTARFNEVYDLPPSYNTICQWAILSKQIFEQSKSMFRICQNLVHDQHLQQQGWASVVANLEDNITDFNNRIVTFNNIFQEFLNEREPFLEFLQNFNTDMETLKKIPVLSTLLEVAKQFRGEFNQSTSSSDTSSNNTNSNNEVAISSISSLYDWITSADNKNCVAKLHQYCLKVVKEHDENLFNNLKGGRDLIFTEETKSEMCDIKGISDRLCGLERLIMEAKECVTTLNEIAIRFAMHQDRARSYTDSIIITGLYDTDRNQLEILIDNYNSLSEIRRRCIKAKWELGANMHRCLKWVMFVQSKLVEFDRNMIQIHGRLKSVRLNIQILNQVHLAPAVYLSAVSEVVRRRAFSQAFLSSASELACYLLTIYNEEVSRRKDFLVTFQEHFLSSLFPGMDDMPPPYAIEAPSPFDTSLPNLTIEDIEQLKSDLPELTDKLVVPDIAAINNLFMLKSFVKTDLSNVEMCGVEEKIVQVVNEVGLASNLDQNLLKPAESETCLVTAGLPNKDNDRGCESETDTEEFEKVGQSPLELHFDKEIQSIRPQMQDVSTLTEVGDRNSIPPKKPPRIFQKSQLTCPIIETNLNFSNITNLQSQRAMSFSGSQSNTESFTNLKNSSLESIDELSSIKNFNSNTDSCFNSHHQQMYSLASTHFSRSKSLSPHTPQSPKDLQCDQLSPSSPIQGHQPNEFINDEFYIDESLPSSLSIETGQSQGEFVRQLDTANNVVALLQDNLQSSRSEYDRLRSNLKKLAECVQHSKEHLKVEVNELRSWFCAEKKNMEIQYESLTSSWENLAVEFESREKEVISKLSQDHKQEVDDLNVVLKYQNNQITQLQDTNQILNNSLTQSYEEISDLKKVIEKLQKDQEGDREIFEKSIIDLKRDNEQNLKDTSDKLNREHKAEKENMKSRFNLLTVAKMQHSPTEAHMDPETIEMSKHESILSQVIENNKAEMEKAIEQAVAEAHKKWECRLKKKIADLEVKHSGVVEYSPEENAGAMAAPKSITKSEIQSRQKVLKEDDEKSKDSDKSGNEMGASVSVYQGKVTASSSTKHVEKLTKSQISLVKSAKLCINSCHSSDTVLVLWDSVYNNYRIIQEDNHLYFLHSDSLENLGLNTKQKDQKPFVIGQVIEKEYCYAKKVENRYNVPKGTKFFRVRVKPLTKHKKGKSIMSQSEIVNLLENEQSSTAVSSSSLPATPLKQSPVEVDSKQGTSVEDIR